MTSSAVFHYTPTWNQLKYEVNIIEHCLTSETQKNPGPSQKAKAHGIFKVLNIKRTVQPNATTEGKEQMQAILPSLRMGHL